MIDLLRRESTVSFEKIISSCADRIQAIFLFLSILELIQQGYMNSHVGEERNIFILNIIPNKQGVSIKRSAFRLEG